jgi:3-oxoacyl-[acyl-carrier protein] reductase
VDVVVVTGCGSPGGIGFATARLLGIRAAKVAVAATTDRIEERGHGPCQQRGMGSRLEKTPSKPFDAMGLADLRSNLATSFNVTRALAPRLIERRGGRIVNVSSVTGPLVSYPGQTGYAAAKGAVEAMTRTFAIELGPRGI